MTQRLAEAWCAERRRQLGLRDGVGVGRSLLQLAPQSGVFVEDRLEPLPELALKDLGNAFEQLLQGRELSAHLSQLLLEPLVLGLHLGRPLRNFLQGRPLLLGPCKHRSGC